MLAINAIPYKRNSTELASIINILTEYLLYSVNADKQAIGGR